MSGKEILDKSINLKESDLTESEKKEFMTLMYEHKAAFSLLNELGQCPNIKIDIEVIDKSPLFVRPFPISEKDKPIMGLPNGKTSILRNFFPKIVLVILH